MLYNGTCTYIDLLDGPDGTLHVLKSTFSRTTFRVNWYVNVVSRGRLLSNCRVEELWLCNCLVCETDATYWDVWCIVYNDAQQKKL